MAQMELTIAEHYTIWLDLALFVTLSVLFHISVTIPLKALTVPGPRGPHGPNREFAPGVSQKQALCMMVYSLLELALFVTCFVIYGRKMYIIGQRATARAVVMEEVKRLEGGAVVVPGAVLALFDT